MLVAISLDAVASVLSELPEVSQDWESMSESDQVGWCMDWGQAMGQYLVFLDQKYRTGGMDPEQAGRYERLLQELKAAMPIINRLELYPPPVALAKGAEAA